jgi:PPOX class probable F420-dependent enzyme
MSRSAAAFVRSQRIGHLATAGRDGQPSVVPFCFVLHGGALLSAIDEKPKQVEPERLRRVTNIRANPAVAVVVDHYSEDWQRLRWVSIRGTACLLDDGAEHRRAVRLLRAKYPQYRAMRLEERPVLKIVPTRVRDWRAAEAVQPGGRPAHQGQERSRKGPTTT